MTLWIYQIVPLLSDHTRPHTTPRHTTPHHATPHHATPCHATPHHTTSRHATPPHYTTRHTTHHTPTTWRKGVTPGQWYSLLTSSMLIHLQWDTSQINTENRMLVPVKASVDLCWWQHWTISTELRVSVLNAVKSELQLSVCLEQMEHSFWWRADAQTSAFTVYRKRSSRKGVTLRVNSLASLKMKMAKVQLSDVLMACWRYL